MQFGLLGRTLGHSLSPQIHACFGDYPYALFCREEDELPAFFADRSLNGFNVTVPYKLHALRACDTLSDAAKHIGAVNTVLRLPDGTLLGDNTDYFGFCYLAKRNGVDFKNKKVVVLGSGGASKTVQAVLKDAVAREIVVVSRTGSDNYGNLSRHFDADILVNTTPVGMFPHNLESPVSLEGFAKLQAVLDLIYNPMETALLRDAASRGIKTGNGLAMLVAQALPAARLFSGKDLPDSMIETTIETIERQQRNVVLIGMPGCGKSTVGALLAKRLGKAFFDTDAMVETAAGMPIPAIFAAEGEAGFRARESAAVKDAGKRLSAVIATGGGSILTEENRAALGQNAVVVYLKKDLSALATVGRPLSKDADALKQLYTQRKPIYEAFADCTVAVSDDATITTERVISCIF